MLLFAFVLCSMGCYVSGLYLEGAAWDHEAGKLRRQAPRQTVDELPILQVTVLVLCVWGCVLGATGPGGVADQLRLIAPHSSSMVVGQQQQMMATADILMCVPRCSIQTSCLMPAISPDSDCQVPSRCASLAGSLGPLADGYAACSSCCLS